MSPEQVRELWSRFLAGAEIGAEDQRMLADALDADADLRESLLENLQLDGMLQAMGTTRRRGEGFVRNLTECLDVEQDGTRFVKKVELRLNEPPPPPAGTGTGRRSRPPTARAFRRRSGGSYDETAWKPALIAAGVFAAILLLVFASTKPVPEVAGIRPRPPKQVPPENPRNEVPPPAPEPKLAPEKPQPATPPTPLIPRKFEDPKPEERPALPRPAEEKQPPVPPAENPRPRETVVVQKPESPTRVERLDGNVYIARNPANKARAAKGDPVLLNHDVETPGASSTAFLRFSDNTWVEVGPNSSFRELAGADAPGGRKVFLKFGTLESHIEKQQEGRPMVFSTPNAEAMILGTTVRLTVSHDAKFGTTLEVKEGKVRFTNSLKEQTVDVGTGQFAVAVEGGELRPQKSFPDEVLVKFGPADVPLKPGWVLDSGDVFDAGRGYGWVGKGGEPTGITWVNPSTGAKEEKKSGRFTARRVAPPGTDPAKATDPLRMTDVVAGWAGQSETWRMPVPNGRYLVSVCCGDISFEQGPHHVAIEGKQVIDQKKNKAGQFVEVLDYPIEVKDGELTMVVGGNPGNRKSSDGSTDTCINYLSIKRIRK